ncbi:MAG: LolA family protein [Alphaproteobacteria bacterium]
MLSRRSLITTLVLTTAAGPAWAALPPDIVPQVEEYLDGIRTLKADFTQIAPDGKTTTGKVYIKRPGRLRFEYDPPEQLLMVARDWRLVVHDRRVDQTSTVPVDRTPLGLLLREEIRIGGPVTIRSLAEISDELHLTVFQTEEPGRGELTLFFGLDPLELRRWEVLDAQGKRTRVLLENVETNVELENRLFSTAGLG